MIRAPLQFGNYAARPGELVPFDTTASTLVLTLPEAPPDQTMVWAKIVAGPNKVTARCGPFDYLDVVNGSVSADLAGLGHSALYQYDAATRVWTIYTTGLPTSLIPSIQTVTGATTPPAPTGGSRENELIVTALAAAWLVAAPTGTPTAGNKVALTFKDNGTSRAVTFNAAFQSGASTLPATFNTVAGKWHTALFRYNAALSKYALMAIDATGY